MHKASPPSQLMTWLGLNFDTVKMMIIIQPAKLTEIADIITEWQGLSHSTLHTLREILEKLHNISQCCLPTHQVFPKLTAGHIESLTPPPQELQL